MVDDSEDCRDAFAAWLGSNGYGVATATNGQDALDQLRAGMRPCLIFLDLDMPGKNGWDFRVEQQEDPEVSRLPVVICSGVEDAHQYVKSLGVQDVVQKPNLERMPLLVELYCESAACRLVH